MGYFEKLVLVPRNGAADFVKGSRDPRTLPYQGPLAPVGPARRARARLAGTAGLEEGTRMRVDGFQLANVRRLLHFPVGVGATYACGGMGPVDTSVRGVTSDVPEATAPLEPDARAAAEPSAIAGGAFGGRAATRTVAEVAGSPESLLCSEGQVATILEANSRGRLDVGNSVRDRLEGRDARAVADKIITDEAGLLVALQGATKEIGLTPSPSTYAGVLAGSGRAQNQALKSISGAGLERSDN